MADKRPGMLAFSRNIEWKRVPEARTQASSCSDHGHSRPSRGRDVTEGDGGIRPRCWVNEIFSFRYPELWWLERPLRVPMLP